MPAESIFSLTSRTNSVHNNRFKLIEMQLLEERSASLFQNYISLHLDILLNNNILLE